MLRKIRTLGAVTIVVGIGVSSACTIKGPEDNTDNGGTAATQGGTSAGGHSGSTSSRAGSTSRAGTHSVANGGEAGSGEGGNGPQCPSCASGFCLDDGTCVDCLASDDQCPAGQYCTDTNECAPGCKDNATSCASGVCDADHNCKNCISDDECQPDLVCGSGQCGAACSLAQEGDSAACNTGLTCCSLHCLDVQTDSKHCGACDNSCSAGQFCGLTTCADSGASGAGGAAAAGCVECHDTTLANLCSVAQITVILDTSNNTSDGNRVPGRAMGAALQAQCMPQPVLTEAEQDSVEALNFKTGRPVSNGGELLVVAGGPVFQNVEGYLEQQKIAPLYWKPGAVATEYRKTANDEVVVSLPIAGDHDSHDIFIIQFMRDAASGSLVLNAQGFWLSGTVAAAYQVNNGILPDLASFDQAWYAYEWTDMNGDKAPDLDEMTLLDSGS